MTATAPTIFLSAAEASGDEHASHLVRAIRDRLPDARILGVGGERMAAAGCEILADLTQQASMLEAILRRLVYYLRMVKRLKAQIGQIRPDVFIPVDSPSLNWHLSDAAKSSGSNVMHYIAPQVWAWAPWRVKKLRRLSDHVACILPFEERYLRDRGVRATYVGHPLFDTLDRPASPLPDLVEAWSQGTWRVALLPGSRPAEIRGHTRALVDVAEAIRRSWPRARCTFTARTAACAEAMRVYSGGREIDVAVGRTRQVLAESHFAVAVSGTVTLEVAACGVPMVIVYRATRLGYHLLARHVIRTPHLSLVNILAGRRIVPELMPWFGNRKKLTATVLELMGDLGYLHDARQALLAMVEPLRLTPPATAAGNAADIVVNLLRKREGRGSNP